jgi:hypothetical protein
VLALKAVHDLREPVLHVRKRHLLSSRHGYKYSYLCASLASGPTSLLRYRRTALTATRNRLTQHGRSRATWRQRPPSLGLNAEINGICWKRADQGIVAAMGESVEIMVQRAGVLPGWGTEKPRPVRYPVIWLRHGLRRGDSAAVITTSELSGYLGSRGGACGMLVPVVRDAHRGAGAGAGADAQ